MTIRTVQRVHQDRIIVLVRLITAAYVVLITSIVICATNNWFAPLFDGVEKLTGDKLMHFFLVGKLALLVNLSLRANTVRMGGLTVQIGTLFLLALATAEEFSQLMFVNRTFDLIDLACNIAGIILLGSLARPLASRLGIG